MPARRCTACGISYPFNMRFTKCMVCSDATWVDGSHEPDEDWNESVIFAKEHLTAADTSMVKGEVVLFTEFGQLWLSAHDLVRAGYGDAIPAGKLLELQDGTVIEVNGRDHKRRAYWVEIVRAPAGSDSIQKFDQEYPGPGIDGALD